MEHPGPEPHPRPDQQAALEELERFGRDIQRYRAQREALGEEFETFVRSFKEPPPGVRAERATPARTETPSIFGPPVPATPVPDTPVIETPGPKAPVLETPVFSTPAPEVAPPATAQPAEAAELPVPPARAQTTTAAIAAGAAILVGGGLLAVLLWNRGPAPSSDPAPNQDAPPAAAPAPSTAPSTAPDSSAAPAAPAAAQAATPAAPSSGSEIVAERRVWMRVTVDGARVLEREVPAGTRIPLKAEKTIVIRTGDAGAVRLSIRGGPGALLGREGEVVTRAFTVPPRGEAPR